MIMHWLHRKDEPDVVERDTSDVDNFAATSEFEANKTDVGREGEKMMAGATVDGVGESGMPVPEGVLCMRAITETWNQRWMWAMLVLIYLYIYMESLLSTTTAQLQRFVTSSFSAHELLATIEVLTTIFSAVSSLVIGKVINIFGRMEGLALMLIFMEIGLIIQCASPDIQAYAAAQSLYSIGNTGLRYTANVLLADMTTLRHRMLVVSLSQFALLANTFAGPALAQHFLNHSTWQWAFGTFTIVIPFLIVPIILILAVQGRRVRREGKLMTSSSGRTMWQSFMHYFNEFDVCGMVLVAAGFTMLLLPISLARGSSAEWRKAHNIVLIVIGGCCLIAFVVWERWGAPIPYLQWQYLKERTVVLAACTYGFMFMSTFCWDNYFSSFVEVVWNRSVLLTGYLVNTYSLASYAFGPLAGLAIMYLGRYKLVAYISIPFEVIGTVLLVFYRRPSSPIGVIAVTQIFIGVGGAIIPNTAQLAMMAMVGHSEVATVLAIYTSIGSVLAAVGSAIGGAIWNSVVPEKLPQYLPAADQKLAPTLFADFALVLKYPMSSPVRQAVIHAYGDAQRIMAIVGACLLSLMVATMVLWKDVKVTNLVQTRGRVF